MNAPDTKPPLEYDRSTSGPTRRQFRLLLILTLINTVLMGWFVAGPQTGQFLRQQWSDWQARRAAKVHHREVLALQQKCLDHIEPADRVIYEEDPTEAARLISEKAGYQPIPLDTNGGAPSVRWRSPAVIDHVPQDWLALADVKNIPNGLYCSPTLPVCFIGERRTPSGTRRLVIIQLQAKQFANVSATNNMYTAEIATTRLLYATSFKLGDETSPPDRMGHWELELLLPESGLTRSVTTDQWQEHRGGNITLLAGQADEKDTSHILLPYRRDGKDGVIDTWLSDDGILLKPREGRLADTTSGLRTWQLDAPSDPKTP